MPQTVPNRPMNGHAVVLDEIDPLWRLLAAEAADLNNRHCPPAGELQRISQQIDEELSQQGWISLTRRQLADTQVDLSSCLLLRQLRQDLAHEMADRHRLRLEGPATQTGEGQQIIYQAAHPCAVLIHPAQVALRVWGQSGRMFVEQDARESADRPQRRAQVVRDGVGEGVELSVDGREFGRPFDDPLFELCVQRTKLLLQLFALGDDVPGRDKEHDLAGLVP